MVLILMGVSACGKTTIGKMLARQLEMEFLDADDFHSPENIIKMKKKIALSDEDRIPWLKGLADTITTWNGNLGGILACSALKETYRKILSKNGKEAVIFVFLEGTTDLILERMKKRTDHIFPLELLENQVATLEEPQNAIKVNIEKSPEEICSEIRWNLSQKISPNTI